MRKFRLVAGLGRQPTQQQQQQQQQTQREQREVYMKNKINLNDINPKKVHGVRNELNSNLQIVVHPQRGWNVFHRGFCPVVEKCIGNPLDDYTVY